MKDVWKLLDQEDTCWIEPPRVVTASAIALVLVLLGIAGRFAIIPVVGDRMLFLLFIPGVIVGAALGGFLPGIAAAFLGSIAGYILLARGGAPVLENRIETTLFATLCVAIALGGERLRRTRKRTVEMAHRIREREAHLQAVLDAVPDAMIVLDEQRHVQSFSPVAEALFGWAARDAHGLCGHVLVPALKRVEPGSHHADTAVGRRKDGSTFPVDLSIGELVSGGRSLTVVFVRDLTERQEADRRLRQLQAEVVHISRLSAMGEMAATLAHELNQPLTAISNFLNGGRRFLQTGHAQDRALEAMERAAAQALRAGQIIRGVRDFVARGEGEPRMENLPALIEEAAALALVGVSESGVDVRFELDPSASVVIADKIQIQQVLLNLIRNAIEAMDGADVRHLLVASSEVEEMAQISVDDTGPGISPEVEARLFHPFTTTKDSGMGVGLSICRTIVEAHGGRIWVEPGPRRGSSFRFTLPLARNEADEV
ncbi:ATP-binding protein [Methylobacterium sp. NPDC080182]|uniref:ATP-binding protein n=1 Tax=Methylobacterium sp. NPDC080182 TaxID=3390590 RepID=UPI003D0699B9